MFAKPATHLESKEVESLNHGEVSRSNASLCAGIAVQDGMGNCESPFKSSLKAAPLY